MTEQHPEQVVRRDPSVLAPLGQPTGFQQNGPGLLLKMVDGNEDIDVMEVLNSLKIVEDFKMKVG